MNYTYILECSDGSLYCGWTNNIEKRVAAHNAGRGAKYTKGRRPVRLVHIEVFDTREEAMKREWRIKKLTRRGKLALISSGEGEGIDNNKEGDETRNHDKKQQRS